MNIPFLHTQAALASILGTNATIRLRIQSQKEEINVPVKNVQSVLTRVLNTNTVAPQHGEFSVQKHASMVIVSWNNEFRVTKPNQSDLDSVFSIADERPNNSSREDQASTLVLVPWVDKDLRIPGDKGYDRRAKLTVSFSPAVFLVHTNR